MIQFTLLDLYCCEGAASIGYHRAGFKVTGVDIVAKYRKRYPYVFEHGDAIEYVSKYGHLYDAIHASPPCQEYSVTKVTHNKQHPDLLAPTRDALIATGKPYVIENVVGARHQMLDPIRLCGCTFNLGAVDVDGTPLRLMRRRMFESNIPLVDNGPCSHDTSIQVGGVYGGGSNDRSHAKNVRRGGYTPSKPIRAALLGLEPDDFTLNGLSQALPPVYTEFIGKQIMDYLRSHNG